MSISGNNNPAVRGRSRTVPPLTNSRGNGDGNGGGGGGGGDIESGLPIGEVDSPGPTGATVDVASIAGGGGAQDVDARGAVAAGGGPQAAGGTVGGGSHETAASNGDLLSEVFQAGMAMIAPFGGVMAGPAARVASDGGSGEIQMTLTITRSDGSAGPTADVGSNLPGGTGGGGQGQPAVGTAVVRAGEGPQDVEGGGGGGDAIVDDAVLVEDVPHDVEDVPDDVLDGGGGGGGGSSTVSMLILALTLPCLWVAGHLPLLEAVMLEVLAALSLTVDRLHARGIVSVEFKVAMYGVTWTVFSVTEIGEVAT